MEKKIMEEASSSDVEDITTTTTTAAAAATNQTHSSANRRKGGIITMPFIIVNEAIEKVATYGLLPNMILYLMKDYHVGVAKGANIIFLWSGAINFMPILGAFLSDSYLGRFLTIGFGSISSFLGMMVLWITTMVPKLRPSKCDIFTEACEPAKGSQMSILVLSYALMAIGAGGVRTCSLAFGADQVDKRDDPKNKRVLERFFNWYYASAAIAVIIALTAIVYIQDRHGWRVGFGVPAILMLFATVFFFLASSLYVKHSATKSLLTGFAQVVVAAYRNRKTPLPSAALFHRRKDSDLVAPSDKLRCLNKACVIRDHERDIGADGSALNPWNVCTVEQVEELKALIKVVPIWSTGLVMSINVSQSTFQLLQANSMDRVIWGFRVPAASFAMFVVVALAAWVIFYDRVFLPLASRLRGRPARIDVKTRMGIGLVFSFFAMVVSALVENARRRRAAREGLVNDAAAVVGMSAAWLIPQHCLNGFAEAFNGIGQTEFYYSEFPKSMSSIASSLFGFGMAVASLLASLVLSAVDSLTSRGGRESWVSSNINKGRYDYYYWLLALMSFVNLFYFALCSWAYGPCTEQMMRVRDEPSHHRNGAKDEDEDRSLQLGSLIRTTVDEGKVQHDGKQLSL